MASHNYHKRRTKERKARQHAQRQERIVKFQGARRRMVLDPGVMLGVVAHSPKMFVRDGKLVPFEFL